MAKVICVPYEDPVTGYPPSYSRAEIPSLSHYPDGQTLPTSEGIDFKCPARSPRIGSSAPGRCPRPTAIG